VQNPYTTDSYIRQCHPRSVLCLPLLNQGKLIGILYLENKLAPRVFVPARITVLKILATQAAISLENSRLYRDLAEREAKIRRLVDADVVGVFTWELEGRILEANDEFLRIIGYDRDDLISGRLRWTDLTPPEWLDRDTQLWVPELKKTGRLQPFEKEYFQKDGSRVPVLIGTASFDESGSQGVAFVLDLTERKRAEAERERLRHLADDLAQRQEKKLRDVIETIPTFAWSALPDGFEDFVNHHWEEYSGLSAEKSAGAGWQAAVHPSDLKRHVDKWRASLVTGEPFENEVRYRRAVDGQYRWFLARAVPLRDARGKILKWYGISTDIEDRKRAEEERETLRADLAHINRVSMMGELTASIAHELNQPLSGVVVNGNACLRWLAGDSPNLEEARENARRIVRDGKRAGDIIARVRAQATKTGTTMARLDMNEAIEEVVALAQPEVRRNNVTLRTELADDLSPVLGDRVQLQQVVLNLVMNAVEAMSTVGERPRELVIRTQNDEADLVRITVQDSGTGLDPQNMERIFDAFYTTKSGGMGMGLSICRSIVQKHGGRLLAVANDGPGTTFQFTLQKYDVASRNSVA
jgi:PAS domain S-box-containing protein